MLRWRRLGGIVGTALVAALAVAAGSGTLPGSRVDAQGGAYVAVETWTSRPAELPPGSFGTASGVAVSSGRLYVADGIEGRISVIDPDETVRVLVSSGGGLDGGLRAPGHLAVDSAAGRVYAADPGAGRVLVFSLDGAPVAAWRDVGVPAGIAVEGAGTVLVADAASGRIGRYDRDGSSMARWQAVPAEPGGSLVGGLDTGPDGRIYAVLPRAAELAVFSPTGQRTATVRIAPPGAATWAVDVEVDPDPRGQSADLIWLASSRGLLLYEPAREAWTVNPVGADLAAVAVERAVGVHIAFHGVPPTGGRVLRLPHATAAASGACRSWSGSMLSVGSLVGPEAVTWGLDGRAYLIDRWPRIQRFDAAGRPLGQADRLEPAAVAASAESAVFVTDGGVVRALVAGDWLVGAPARAWESPVSPSGADANAVALAVVPGSDRVLALDALGGVVRAFHVSGAPLADRSLGGLATSSTIWSDMDVGPDGTLYVLDRGNDAVHVLPPSGAPSRIAIADGARRLAAAADGSVRALGRDGWVRVYDASGAPVTAFDATRFDVAPASSPSDLATSSDDILVTDREADLVTRFRWDPAATPGTPPQSGAACRHFPGKVVSPASVDLGASAEVRLTVRGGCGSGITSEPLDVLLVLDRSGSMQEDRLRTLKGAALNFVADVDFAVTRVGVISFNDQARVEVGLTGDPSRVRRAIQGLEADGTTRIDLGLEESRAELARRGRAAARPVFIVMSDGGSDFDEARRQADRAKDAGVEIFSVGIQAWARLMREIATDEAHYFQADSNRFLYGVFGRISERVTTTTLFRTVVVRDRLPANMAYVADSAVPRANYDQATRTLEWQLENVPFTGLSLRYRVTPSEPGDWPTNESAWAEYVDGFGAAGRLEFPVPRLTVRFDTPEPATPTATAPPSPTPTASATPSPTSRPTAAPERLFLPLVLKEHCQPGIKPADVVLVMDTSSSMEGEKLRAAKSAAVAFLDLIAAPEDRVALVAFDTAARRECGLTRDFALLRSSVEALATAPGTRIDLGLASALDELQTVPAGAERTAVIVLLTDGRQDDESLVLDQADRARAAEVVIFAIGLGQDVDAEFLGRIAGSSAQTYLAPRPGDLAAIYERIAVLYPCPPESFWPLR